MKENTAHVAALLSAKHVNLPKELKDGAQEVMESYAHWIKRATEAYTQVFDARIKDLIRYTGLIDVEKVTPDNVTENKIKLENAGYKILISDGGIGAPGLSNYMILTHRGKFKAGYKIEYDLNYLGSNYKAAVHFKQLHKDPREDKKDGI